MTPAERVVVEAAVRWRQARQERAMPRATELVDAVEALLAERAGPQPETVEITWGQVVEGDQVYRARNGAPMVPDAPGGSWMEVIRSGLLAGTDRMRVNVCGIGKPIQPEAAKPVIVKRGATGAAVNALGSVLWSGPTSAEVR